MSFERREAIVTYEKGTVTIDQMGQAVAQYGFKVTLQPSPTREGR